MNDKVGIKNIKQEKNMAAKKKPSASASKKKKPDKEENKKLKEAKGSEKFSLEQIEHLEKLRKKLQKKFH